LERSFKWRVDWSRIKDITHERPSSCTPRLKALYSEQRARESSEPRSKEDWEELAIEWHMLANLAARAKGAQIDFA
jgi:hypothetical protein